MTIDLPPHVPDLIHHVGEPCFHVSWRYVDDHVVVAIACVDPDRDVRLDLVGDTSRGRQEAMRPDDLVAAVTRAWPTLAAPYLSDLSWWTEATTLALPGADPATFEPHAGWLLVSCRGKSLDLAEESFLAVEGLRALADHVAGSGMTSPAVAARWMDLSNATLLPRMRSYVADLSAHDDPPQGEDDRAIAWYAGHHWMDERIWRRTAVDAHATERLYRAGLMDQPEAVRSDASWATHATQDEVDRLVRRLADITGETTETIMAAAYAERLALARSELARSACERRDAFLAGPTSERENGEDIRP